MGSFKLLLVGTLALVTVTLTQAKCDRNQFECLNGAKCISRSWFCDRANDCGDNSDEKYCDYDTKRGCPKSWFSCIDGQRCVPSYWRCDGVKMCRDGSDELECNSDIIMIPQAISAKARLSSWLMNQRRNTTAVLKWGHNVPITAVALFLYNKTFFFQRSIPAIEISYEVPLRLLDTPSQGLLLSTQELALYIQALLVICMNPREFHQRDLVSELRRRVDSNKEIANPFFYLVLCNAGDSISNEDAEKVLGAFHAKKRPNWFDTQALTAMALTCFTTKANISISEESMNTIFTSLNSYQDLNNTIPNAGTTALIIQAMLLNKSKDFDLEATTLWLVNAQMEDGSYGSILNAFYILPALSGRSMLNVGSEHCTDTTDFDDTENILNKKEETMEVVFSIWIGENVDLVKSMMVHIPQDKTCYDLFEVVQKNDPRLKFEYDFFDGKPYVRRLLGFEDDHLRGLYWFMHKRSLRSKKTPEFIEQSPVDVIVTPDHEIILWYKKGTWNGTAHVPTFKNTV